MQQLFTLASCLLEGKSYNCVPWGVFCRHFGNMRYQGHWCVPSGPYTICVKACLHSQQWVKIVLSECWTPLGLSLVSDPVCNIQTGSQSAVGGQRVSSLGALGWYLCSLRDVFLMASSRCNLQSLAGFQVSVQRSEWGSAPTYPRLWFSNWTLWIGHFE